MKVEPLDVELKISHLQGIPALPTNVNKLIRLTLDEKVSTRAIADLISRDPALSAKLLKTVNSPFYGFPRRISTVTQATVILGISSVRSIAMSLSVLEFFQNRNRLKSYLPKFMEHSLSSGVAAFHLAQQAKYPLPEEAFMAGLLHDIGSLVLFECCPDVYPEVLQIAEGEQVSLTDAEVSLLGIHHARAGELVCRGWGFPRSLETAIRNHHHTGLQWEPGDPGAALSALTRMADLAAHALTESRDRRAIEDFCAEVQRLLAWEGKEALKFLEALEPQAQEIAGCLEVRIPRRREALRMIVEASQALAQSTLEYELRGKQMSETIEKMQGAENELRLENERLQNLSDRDGLTGVYNHRYFQKRLTEEISRARRGFYPLALIMIDLDHFKEVNDNLGHLTGDRVLREFAMLLKTWSRDSDVVARYGGEEFAIILPNADTEMARGIVLRLQERLKKSRFVRSGPDLSVTFSAGIATLLPEQVPHKLPRELIREADRALLGAKNAGRNQTHLSPL